MVQEPKPLQLGRIAYRRKQDSLPRADPALEVFDRLEDFRVGDQVQQFLPVRAGASRGLRTPLCFAFLEIADSVGFANLIWPTSLI